MSSNPLNIEDLFTQLDTDIQKRMDAPHGYVHSGGMRSVELRINSYSRIIKAHPENTHDNTRIPSTEVLLKKIDSCIEMYGKYLEKEGHALAAEAFTRIISGRK